MNQYFIFQYNWTEITVLSTHTSSAFNLEQHHTNVRMIQHFHYFNFPKQLQHDKKSALTSNFSVMTIQNSEKTHSKKNHN